MQLKHILFYSFFFFLFITTSGQTAGSGILSSIESKADLIESNDKKFADLNRQHLGSYGLEADKLAKMKRELASLIAEKTAVIDEYKRGQFCTGCNIPRSQFKPGESFPHPGQSVRPATPQEIEAKEKYYDDKIAALQDQIKEFEFGENEFTRKRADLDKQMNQLKQSSDDLRAEIVELSKQYKDAIVNEGDRLALSLIDPLMKITADKHYIEDRLNIITVKLADLDKEQQDATAQAKVKAQKFIDDKKVELNNKINANLLKLDDLKTAKNSRVNSLEIKLISLRSDLEQLKSKLINPSALSESVRLQLESQKQSLESQISDYTNQIETIQTQYKSIENKVELENKQYSDEIWQVYTVNASKIIDDAVNAVLKSFVMRRKILIDARAARTVALQETGQLLILQTADKRSKFMAYASIVDAERIRLLKACSKAGCSCYGSDAHGMVIGRWNRAEGCVAQMDFKHNGSVYYGCEAEAAMYQSYYTSNLNGLSDSDLEAYQRKVSKTRFDMITKKITD